MPLCRVAMPARPQGQPGGMGCRQGAPCRQRDTVGSRCDVTCTVPAPGELELDRGGMRVRAIPAAQMWFSAAGPFSCIRLPGSRVHFGIGDVPPPSTPGLPAPSSCPEAPRSPLSGTSGCTEAFQEQGQGERGWSPAVQSSVSPSYRPPRPGGTLAHLQPPALARHHRDSREQRLHPRAAPMGRRRKYESEGRPASPAPPWGCFSAGHVSAGRSRDDAAKVLPDLEDPRVRTWPPEPLVVPGPLWRTPLAVPFPQLVSKPPPRGKAAHAASRAAGDRDGCPTAPRSPSPPLPVPIPAPGTVLGQGRGTARGTGSGGPGAGESSRLPHGRSAWQPGSAAQPVPASDSPLSAPSPPKPLSPEKRMRHRYLQGQVGKPGHGEIRRGG